MKYYDRLANFENDREFSGQIKLNLFRQAREDNVKLKQNMFEIHGKW